MADDVLDLLSNDLGFLEIFLFCI